MPLTLPSLINWCQSLPHDPSLKPESSLILPPSVSEQRKPYQLYFPGSLTPLLNLCFHFPGSSLFLSLDWWSNLLTTPACIPPPRQQPIFPTCYWRHFSKAHSYTVMSLIMLRIIKHFFFCLHKFCSSTFKALGHPAFPLFLVFISWSPSPLDLSYNPAVSWHPERRQALVCLMHLASPRTLLPFPIPFPNFSACPSIHELAVPGPVSWARLQAPYGK